MQGISKARTMNGAQARPVRPAMPQRASAGTRRVLAAMRQEMDKAHITLSALSVASGVSPGTMTNIFAFRVELRDVTIERLWRAIEALAEARTGAAPSSGCERDSTPSTCRP